MQTLRGSFNSPAFTASRLNPLQRTRTVAHLQSAHILNKNILTSNSSKSMLLPARTHTHNACLLHFPLPQIFSFW